MPKMTRQTKAQKREVRAIQNFIKKHGYIGGFDFKLHNTGYDNGHYAIGICSSGVVLSFGGGAIIDDWTNYKSKTLRKFLNGAIKIKDKKLLQLNKHNLE